MIRGAIESATRAEVAGWLYCSIKPLKDDVVLAFVGDTCVGSGKIEIYRQDLHNAGLGDGVCGFAFPIKPIDDSEASAIVVRLEGSDLALMQKPAASAQAKPRGTAKRAAFV